MCWVFRHLDIVKGVDGRLEICPFSKPMDCNSYLHFNSFHPRHQRNKIPYGQLLRIKRNSNKDLYTVGSHNLLQLFKRTGYFLPVLNQDADKISRQELIRKQWKERSTGKHIAFGFDYSPLSNEINKIMLWHWYIVKEVPGCK